MEFEKLLILVSEIFDEIALYKKTSGEILENYSISEMHCIDFIEKNQNANVTKIASSLMITKGGVSKIIKKLRSKGAIEIYKTENNKKEIYFKLTAEGKKIFFAHEKMHKEWCSKNADFFKHYNKEDLKIFSKILKDYNTALKARREAK